MRSTLRVFLPVLMLVGLSRAQDDAAATPATPAPVEVWVIGASLSNGFVDPKPRPDGERNSTVSLARALRDVWSDGRVRLVDKSDPLTFFDPVDRQKTKLGDAGDAAKPALVLGIDYPFWFGYGRVDGDELTSRLALQREGLALLDGIDAPIVLGDYPDMTGADPRMLSAAQIPSPEARKRLNEELAKWAAARDNVTVFPLANHVAAIKAGGWTERYGHRDVPMAVDDLLQGDRLHPTRLGMAIVAARLTDHLREVLGEDHALRPEPRGFEAFVVDCGADVAMDWLLEDLEAEEDAGKSGSGDSSGKRDKGKSGDRAPAPTPVTAAG